MGSLSLSFLKRVLVFLRRLSIFLCVHICGTAIFLAGDVDQKGQRTAQISADTLLRKNEVCVRGIATREKGLWYCIL